MVEGLLSTGPTPSIFFVFLNSKINKTWREFRSLEESTRPNCRKGLLFTVLYKYYTRGSSWQALLIFTRYLLAICSKLHLCGANSQARLKILGAYLTKRKEKCTVIYCCVISLILLFGIEYVPWGVHVRLFLYLGAVCCHCHPN